MVCCTADVCCTVPGVFFLLTLIINALVFYPAPVSNTSSRVLPCNCADSFFCKQFFLQTIPTAHIDRERACVSNQKQKTGQGSYHYTIPSRTWEDGFGGIDVRALNGSTTTLLSRTEPIAVLDGIPESPLSAYFCLAYPVYSTSSRGLKP